MLLFNAVEEKEKRMKDTLGIYNIILFNFFFWMVTDVHLVSQTTQRILYNWSCNKDKDESQSNFLPCIKYKS